MTIYVVMRYDGNVCCPAEELDSVWSTRDLAERRVSILRSADGEAHVLEMQVDGEVIGL